MHTPRGRVILVRHAQASFGSANYDQLSERGERQAQRLADWMVAHPELNFSYVAAGTLHRHAQTLAAIEAAFTRAQRALPALVQDADWNEFDHDALLRAYAGRRAEDPLLLTARSDHRAAHALMRAVLHAWAGGELDEAIPESWNVFGARVARARSRLDAAASGRILIVSSGGPIARCAQAALGCDDRRAVTLNLALRNTAVSEFHTRDADWDLHIWNMLPHLAAPEDADHVTYY
jgi:broad specificity phosphatase PhoE